MYLFFDTETTGLPRDWRAPITDLNNWPRIVQIAWQIYDDSGKEIESRNHIIRPDGFVIPEQAAKVHGITTQRALEEGIELREALGEFADALSASGYLIAHNISFDEKVTGAEFLRIGLPLDLFALPKICTMFSSINHCNIPGQYGSPKWPTLMELHTTLFKKGFEDAHDALVDVAACAKCFFELKELGVIEIL